MEVNVPKPPVTCAIRQNTNGLNMAKILPTFRLDELAIDSLELLQALTFAWGATGNVFLKTVATSFTRQIASETGQTEENEADYELSDYKAADLEQAMIHFMACENRFKSSDTAAASFCENLAKLIAGSLQIDIEAIYRSVQKQGELLN
jgi:hypothetical protein